MREIEALTRVELAPYDPAWATAYARERDAVLGLGGSAIQELEHIGSTSIPGLQAKPIIDMMAAVADLHKGRAVALRLEATGYRIIETGMRRRLFLRRRSEADGQLYQLHVVEGCTWGERKERLMRDYLLAHSDAVVAYGNLKVRLAEQYSEDSLAYTKAKTSFIQGIIDNARAGLGLPPVDVWSD